MKNDVWRRHRVSNAPCTVEVHPRRMVFTGCQMGGGASMLDRYSRLLATAMIPCKACISKSVVGRVSVGKTVEYNQPSKSIPKPFLSFPFVYSFTLVGSLLMRLGEFPREWNRDWSSFDECCWSGLSEIRWRIWKWMMDGQIEILDKIFRYFNRSNK